FMGGITGQFFRSFGAAICVAVLCSLFVSFTLTPMIASRWFHKGDVLENEGDEGRGLGAWMDRNYGRFRERYRKFLAVCLRHPWVVATVGNIVLVVVMAGVGPHLGFRFAPGQDQNQVQVTIEAPAGSSLAYTTRITTEVERRIRQAPNLKNEFK